MATRSVLGKARLGLATTFLSLSICPMMAVAQTTLKCPPNSCCFNIDLSLEESGDWWYGPDNWDWGEFANSAWIVQMKRAFGMSNKNWGESWRTPTSITQPMGRAFTAIVALTESSPDPGWPAISASDRSGNTLKWGGGYTAQWIDDLRARCTHPKGYAAFTKVEGLFTDERVAVYIKWFQMHVPSRAAILVHEARHWDSEADHNAGTKDSSFGFGGPWAVQLSWLYWYTYTAVNAQPLLQCETWLDAISIRDNQFSTTPDIKLPNPYPGVCD